MTKTRDLKRTVRAWLTKYDLLEGVKFWTREQWNETRWGGTSGSNLLFALIFEDGDLYSVLNGHFGWKFHTDFYETLSAKHPDIVAEHCQSWNLLFYRDSRR